MVLSGGDADPARIRDEVRLALVLNGGISLAVWMGGVVHELDLLRRASREGGIGNVHSDDREVFRLWKELAEDVGKRVLIDVIAGTSAGGLNGMLLATAIGRGAALPPLMPMWGKAAALGELLASPAGPNALMQGEKITQALKEVVNDMGRYDAAHAETVTLLLTATALDGLPQKFTDSYDAEFDVRDHRRTYRFTHDPQHCVHSKEDGIWAVRESPLRDFDGGDDVGECNALIQAARATASFPVAFSPVDEEPMQRHRTDKVSLPSGCVMDGGVLNNEPITEVLDAIAERKVDQDVDRVLVYIVPSAARLADEKSVVPCEDTTWSRAALSALNYPRESNMRAAAGTWTTACADGLRTARGSSSWSCDQARSTPELASPRRKHCSTTTESGV
jgi:patatin-related protein